MQLDVFKICAISGHHGRMNKLDRLKCVWILLESLIKKSQLKIKND